MTLRLWHARIFRIRRLWSEHNGLREVTTTWCKKESSEQAIL